MCLGCESRVEDPDGYRNCSGIEVAQIIAILSLYKWKLTRKCPESHYWKPGWMLFFFKLVEYDVMPRSGQILFSIFWTDCKLCGSQLQWQKSGVSLSKAMCLYPFYTGHMNCYHPLFDFPIKTFTSLNLSKMQETLNLFPFFQYFLKIIYLFRLQGN